MRDIRDASVYENYVLPKVDYKQIYSERLRCGSSQALHLSFQGLCSEFFALRSTWTWTLSRVLLSRFAQPACWNKNPRAGASAARASPR